MRRPREDFRRASARKSGSFDHTWPDSAVFSGLKIFYAFPGAKAAEL